MAHVRGHLSALAAAARENARLGAERPADDEAPQADHGRIEHLHSEAAARAQAFLDGRG